MSIISDKAHNFLADYLLENNRIAENPKRKTCHINLRLLGLIGIEAFVLTLDTVLLIRDIAIKILLPIIRFPLYLGSKCFPCLKKNSDDMKNTNENAHPLKQLIRVTTLVAALAFSASIGWLFPCLSRSWHEALGLEHHKGPHNPVHAFTN